MARVVLALVVGLSALVVSPSVAAADGAPAVVLEVTEATAVPDDVLHYDLAVTNPGTTDLTGVSVVDLDAVCAAPATTIGGGATIHVACTHVTSVADVGSYGNQATVHTDQFDPVTSDAVSTTVAFPAHGFSDVPVDASFAPGVTWASFVEVVAGFGDGTYRPGAPVTRGQIVNMLWVMVDRPVVSTAHGFGDVPRNAFYRKALNWAKARGLVTGFAGNRYRPGDPVTRAQFVNMVWKLVGSPFPEGSSGYTDVPLAFRPAVTWAVNHDLLDTIAPGTRFRPGRAADRGQVAHLLHAVAADQLAWSRWTRPPVSTWRFDDADVLLPSQFFVVRNTRIRAGETVSWTNTDDEVHDVTSVPSSTFVFLLAPAGPTVHRTFPTTGVFPYVCELHPGMHGTVTVV